MYIVLEGEGLNWEFFSGQGVGLTVGNFSREGGRAPYPIIRNTLFYIYKNVETEIVADFKNMLTTWPS